MIYVIGCGGVGSWLAQAMVRLTSPRSVVLVDGDTLEEKNLDRQLFSKDEIGKNKAMAMAERIGCRGLPEWYSKFAIDHSPNDWLMCCVDNNPARKQVIEACDLYECSAIVSANEVHSSEAYAYLPEWRNTSLDPRNYYPEINKDTTGDPASAAIGCTGEAQEQNRQLVTANFMASALAAHMYVVWAMESRKTKPESRAFMPSRLAQNLTRNSFVLRGEVNQQTEQKEQA